MNPTSYISIFHESNLDDLLLFIFLFYVWCLIDVGGKAKPLKQPKSEKKEYDEVTGSSFFRF